MQFGRYYEEFEVGAVYRHWPGKTVTEYDDHLFCLLTMNHHPLHMDAHYAETASQFKRNVVVGNYIYSLLLGMSVPDVSGKAIANLEVESLRHVAPTFHGDTIYGETTVLDKRESGLEARPGRGHRGDPRLQPGRHAGLRLPPQGHGPQEGVRGRRRCPRASTRSGPASPSRADPPDRRPASHPRFRRGRGPFPDPGHMLAPEVPMSHSVAGEPPSAGRRAAPLTTAVYSAAEWDLLTGLPGRVIVAAAAPGPGRPAPGVAAGLAGLDAVAAGRAFDSDLVRAVVAAIYARARRGRRDPAEPAHRRWSTCWPPAGPRSGCCAAGPTRPTRPRTGSGCSRSRPGSAGRRRAGRRRCRRPRRPALPRPARRALGLRWPAPVRARRPGWPGRASRPAGRRAAVPS